MKNITVTVDDEIYRRARVKAAEMDSSISALFKEFLLQLTSGELDFDRRKRLERETIAAIRDFSAADRLSRDELHERHALS
jgi:antitoxin component of RelBE/YafQ-DinJ toxin-antitoxin module